MFLRKSAQEQRQAVSNLCFHMPHMTPDPWHDHCIALQTAQRSHPLLLGRPRLRTGHIVGQPLVAVQVEQQADACKTPAAFA
jgi:hypothetical protein